MAVSSVKIFTLNCWGIPLVSKNRATRMSSISEYLARGNHNVVCLQELWSEQDYLLIKDRVRAMLPYSHYFYSGVAGSGLAVFSAWRIEDVFFHQWALNGYIHKIQHGDWFGGKGVGVCRLRAPHFSLNVYCVHLVAEYGSGNEYEGHRVVQAHSLAELMRVTSGAAELSVLAGDLNAEPQQLPYRLITEVGGFSDTLCSSGEATCQHPDNSYTSVGDTTPLRIDHILYHAQPHLEVEVVQSGRVLAMRVPGANCSHSDHEALGVHLRVRALQPAIAGLAPLRREASNTIDHVLREARDTCERALKEARSARVVRAAVCVALLLLCVLLDQDAVRLFALCAALYCGVMATLWYLMEANALKACISALDNRLLADDTKPHNLNHH